MRQVLYLVLVVGLLGACEPSGCEPESGGIPDVICIFRDPPQAPHQSHGTATAITAKLQFRCNRPGADYMEINMKVERKVAGVWLLEKAHIFSESGRSTLRPKGKKWQTRTLAMPCKDGVYRTRVEVFGRRGSSQPYRKMVSPEHQVECDVA